MFVSPHNLLYIPTRRTESNSPRNTNPRHRFGRMNRQSSAVIGRRQICRTLDLNKQPLAAAASLATVTDGYAVGWSRLTPCLGSAGPGQPFNGLHNTPSPQIAPTPSSRRGTLTQFKRIRPGPLDIDISYAQWHWSNVRAV